MIDILDAAILYAPDAAPPDIGEGTVPGWESFDNLAIVEWEGVEPVPAGAELLAAVDGSRLTKICHWADYGHLAIRERFGIPYPVDFLAIRKQMAGLLLLAGGWDFIDEKDRFACVEYFLATDAQKASLSLEAEEVYQLSSGYDQRAQKARSGRIEKVRTLIFNYVERPGYEGIFTASAQLLELYTNLGILGVIDGDSSPGILDYINGFGVFASGNGFLDENFDLKSPAAGIPITKEQLRDAITSILKDG